jgi:hypothetical protein
VDGGTQKILPFTVHGRRGTEEEENEGLTAALGLCDMNRDPAAGCRAWIVGGLARRDGDGAWDAGAPRRLARDGAFRSRDRIAMASSSSPAAEQEALLTGFFFRVPHSLFFRFL